MKNNISYYLAFTSIFIVLSVFGCKMKESTTNSDTENENKVTLIKGTFYDQYPGVQSNYKKSRSFYVSFAADLKQEVVIKALRVGEFEIPVGKISLDGTKLADRDYAVSGNFLKIEAWAGMSFFHDGKERTDNTLLEEPLPAGVAQIVGESGGNSVVLLEFNIEKLQDVYAP